jgi:hypothetical protein
MQNQSPAGVRGRGDPAGATPRRLPGTPAESKADWSGNQHTRLTQPYNKIIKIELFSMKKYL